jgi:signal peptidase I
MKMKFRKIAIICLAIIASCEANDLQTLTAQTAGNDPTIKKGEQFSYSQSIEPSRFDLICFSGEVPSLEGKYPQVYRLCGMPGDLIEIKNGELYVNNRLVDTNIKLRHNYSIPKHVFEEIKNSVPIDANYTPNFQADTLVIPMDDEYVQRNKINAVRQVVPKSRKDSIIASRFTRSWNQDFFGPIKVPTGAYFVLGDNRHNAWDSRYRGFIDKKDFLGTVILDR